MDEKNVRSSAELKERIFNRILNPILSLAKDKGFLAEQPTVENTISSCYRLGMAAAVPNTGNPPPLIVKLSSSDTRINVMKCKREAVFGPNQAEKEMGCRFFAIAEDLTQPTYKKMKELQDHEDVDKAWSFEGRLQFTLVGSKTVHKVASVYDDVNVIISKVQS